MRCLPFANFQNMRCDISPVSSTCPGDWARTSTIFIKFGIDTPYDSTARQSKGDTTATDANTGAFQQITPAAAGNAAAAAASAGHSLQLIIRQLLRGGLQILFRQIDALSFPEIDDFGRCYFAAFLKL